MRGADLRGEDSYIVGVYVLVCSTSDFGSFR